MATFICNYSHCGKKFRSRYSTAKFCSRSCSAKNSLIILSNRKNGMKYTDEELLNHLRKQAVKYGCTPTTRMFESDKSLPNPFTYRERFGTWNIAIMKAGLEPRLSLPSIPRAIIIAKLRKSSTICKTKYKGDIRLVPLKLRFEILARDGFRCQYCGGTPSDGYILHIDHIIPFSKGGKTVKENLITACVICNFG